MAEREDNSFIPIPVPEWLAKSRDMEHGDDDHYSCECSECRCAGCPRDSAMWCVECEAFVRCACDCHPEFP